MSTESDRVTSLLAAAKRVKPSKTPSANPDVTKPEILTLEEMFARFVHISSGPMIVDKDNPQRRMQPKEFTATYGHLKMVVEKKAVPLTSLWQQSEKRMVVDCLTFHPGESTFFADNGLRHLNLWSPPTWPEVDLAKAKPFFDHVDYLIPTETERNHFLDWLSHAVQKPAERPHFHFLFLASNEGTGRSWIADLGVKMWSLQYADSVDIHKLLEDNFNAELSRKILMSVHEVMAPAQERHNNRDRLKSTLTDAFLKVNEKFEKKHTERFCARFMMFTNNENALPLSEKDRRVYVVRCTNEPKDADYYTTLYGRLKDEAFIAAVWHALGKRDIKGFNPGMRAPLNAVKLQMIGAGRSEEQRTAVEFVNACPFEVVGASDLMRALVPEEDRDTPSIRQKRSLPIAAVLRAIGMQTADRKVKLSGHVQRVWILKNTGKWIDATSHLLTLAAREPHELFLKNSWHAPTLISIWKPDWVWDEDKHATPGETSK